MLHLGIFYLVEENSFVVNQLWFVTDDEPADD